MDKEARTCCSRRSGSFWYQFSAIEGSNPCFFAKASKYSRQLLASLQCLVGYLGSEMGKKIFSNGFLPPLFPTPFTTDAIREGERGGGGKYYLASFVWNRVPGKRLEGHFEVCDNTSTACHRYRRPEFLIPPTNWKLREDRIPSPVQIYKRIPSELILPSNVPLTHFCVWVGHAVLKMFQEIWS